MNEQITREDLQYYVDWTSLKYYDIRIKEYIQSSSATQVQQEQLRSDLDQLERLITTLVDNFTIDKKHIYDHIEACKNRSATKEELKDALDELHEEIKSLTGVDLEAYATKDFVEDKLKEIGYNELPDNLVTSDDIKDFVTKEELSEELSKITPPEVDLTSLATKEELKSVEEKIPSVEGLASETYVDEKVASIVIPEVPTKVSELENDAGYITAADIPEADLSDYYNKTEVEEVVAEAVSSIEHPTVSLDGYATEEYVDNAVAGIEIPEVDLTDYATKDDVAQVEAKIPSIDGLATEDFVNQQFENFELPDLTNYATIDDVKGEVAKLVSDAPEQLDTLSELAQALEAQSEVLDTFATKNQLVGLASEQFVVDEISKIKIPDTSDFITTIPEEYVTDEELSAKGYLTEHQSLEGYAKTATVVSQKYEVLPVDGMLVLYGDNEVRINTARVQPVLQDVGATGNPNMYYVTFRAYAPEGATQVIEGQSDKLDTAFSPLATDAYGRKYTTIWAAIAMTTDGGNTWSKWGDSSTVDKYLGFYYNFHWYNEDTLISMDKVRVILTNDACHNDLVEDAVARRIDEKVSAVSTEVTSLTNNVTNITEDVTQLTTNVTNLNETVSNVTTQVTELEQNVQKNYITIENGVTRDDLEEAVRTQVETEIDVLVEEKIEKVVEQGVITYGEFEGGL